MEPITTALAAALAKLAEPAINDAYQGLKALLVKKLGARDAVVDAVERLEQKPTSTGRQSTLDEELADSPARNDPEIAAATQALVERLKQHGGVQQNVQQNVAGDRNIFSGTGDIHLGGKAP